MALPPTPEGYDSWNDYIETEAPALALAEGLTLQEAKASLKLLYVSEPIRSAVGEPYYREYNVFTTWADRALLPNLGRPWKLTPDPAPEPVLTNLQLYYDPSNVSSYSGAGTTVNSLVSPNLTGTMNNITFTSPYFNYNGSDSTISIADNASLEPGSGDFTIEAWVYYTTITGSSRVIVGKTDGGGAQDWGYGLRTGSTGTTFFEVGNGTTSIQSANFTVSTGQWYQVVGVWTNVASNSIALYRNGTLIGSTSHAFASVKNTTSPLYIGSFNGGQFSQWLNGRTGIIRYYNAALSGADILQNFNADKSKYGL